MWSGVNDGGSYLGDASVTDMDPSTPAIDVGWEMLEGDRGSVTQAAALVRRSLWPSLGLRMFVCCSTFGLRPAPIRFLMITAS